MPSSLNWTRQARLDVLDIYELIGLEQPAAAERYFDRIDGLASLLREQPRLGVARPDIAPGFRMLIERPYLLLYRSTLTCQLGRLMRLRSFEWSTAVAT